MPDDVSKLSDKEMAPWKTEYDVVTALEDLGHESKTLGAINEVAAVRRVLQEWKPHIVFNLLEEFRGEGFYVPYLLGYLQLVRQSFTGCNPASLLLADNKVMTKKILRYHRIPVPEFVVFPLGRKIKRPKRLEFPLIVKSSVEHGSVGIAQASIVYSDEKLEERVRFVHEKIQTGAIAEQYIEGRELYVGVLGNRQLKTFPVWEMVFESLPEGTLPIATAKVKWDAGYQERGGIKTSAAKNLPGDVEKRIWRICKRVYRILGLNGYARMDFRLTDDGKIYLLEPNPNPDLAYGDEFSSAAEAVKIGYEPLIQRILNLGIRYSAEWSR
ncbi:MAG: ATP-grasp domain-containing protein [Planctomycetota bacterium]|nr:ATP-grasp domain-containing protein [Planctomycetota bacterium]